MKLKSIDLILQIERLAEALPWDTVELWVSRKPEGEYRFTCYVRENTECGFKSAFGNGLTPHEAVDDAIRSCGERDPEIARKQAIAKLKEQISKLESVVIGMPPYRPGREIGNGEPVITVPDPIVQV